MQKILLLSAPTEFLQDYHKYYPLGLIYLSAVLRKKGHEVIVKDYFYDKKKADTEFYDIVDSFKPDLIGFSMFTMNRVSSCRMARALKQEHKNIKIIAGGPHASYMYNQLLLNFDFDIIAIGEAELTILDLVESIESNSDLMKVKGIAFIGRDSKIHVTETRSFLEDINILPFPTHLDFKDKISISREAYIMSSRGCPIGCIYCSTSHYWGKRWRARSPQNVVDEIEYLLKTFPFLENVMFHDDAFTLDKTRTINICREILGREIKVQWNCQTRVDSLTKDVASWMKKAGCRHVYIGAESGSQKIIDNMGKRISIDGIKQAAKILDEAGIPYGIYLMVGNPGESDDTVNETIELLQELAPTNFNRPAILQIYPGTQMYEKAKREEFINDEYWATDSRVPLYTKEVSLEQLRMWCNRIALSMRKKKGFLATLNSMGSFIVKHSVKETLMVAKEIIKDFFTRRMK